MKLQIFNSFTIDRLSQILNTKIVLTPLQTKITLIFAAFLCLLGSASFFYFTYFKSKKIGPILIPLHSKYSESQKLLHTHLNFAHARYRGNVMESIPAILSDTKDVFMKEKIDVIGMVDADAMHVDPMGFKETYSNFRNADPNAIKNGCSVSPHELNEINLQTSSENSLSHSLKKQAILNRVRQHQPQTKDLTLQFNQDEFVRDTFTGFFGEMHKLTSLNSSISYKPKGAVLAAISDDNIRINTSGNMGYLLLDNSFSNHTDEFFEVSDECEKILNDKSAKTAAVPLISDEQLYSDHQYPRSSYNGGYLLMASDKFFKHFTVSEIGSEIKSMVEKKFSLQEMSKRFAEIAISKGMNDFFNVALVKL